MRMSSAQARQARPMRERPMNSVSAIIITSVTPTISRREYGTVTVKSPPIWNSMAPEISTGTDTSRAPCASRTSFCRKIDMPMAEISGARRGPPRKGRYATRSTAKP
ncbi:hypothetical protein D9M71_837530 [compost metagenome]